MNARQRRKLTRECRRNWGSDISFSVAASLVSTERKLLRYRRHDLHAARQTTRRMRQWRKL